LTTDHTFSDEIPAPLDSSIFFLQTPYHQSSPQPRQSLLSQEDLQRIEDIQMVYQNRIELGKLRRNRKVDFLFDLF